MIRYIMPPLENSMLGGDTVALALEGLASGRLHEFYSSQSDDGPSVVGFAAILASLACQQSGIILWLRHERAEQRIGRLQAEGLVHLGLDPGRVLFVMASDPPNLLRAAVDAVRCTSLGAVVIEVWGKVPTLDLTASRRLMLAAEKSGVTILLLRIDAEPTTSAAETRWSVTAASSSALEANAPGQPAFDIELLRRRAGPAGLTARLEWNRDQHCFETKSDSTARTKPCTIIHAPADREAEEMPRLVVPVSADRPAAQRAAA
jgi:protein ImuA